MISYFYLDETFTGITSPSPNNNEGGLHNPQGSRTRSSSSGGLVSYPGHSLVGGLPTL